MPLSTVLLLMPGLGITEIIFIFLIIILLFGATRLPQIGRGLGEGIRNFKKGLKAAGEDDELDQLEEKRETRRAP
jgi:sec-independent protein translocase protein TatA